MNDLPTPSRVIRSVIGDNRQIAGVFDYVDPGCGLRGWLVHPAVPGLPLWVEAWCDNRLLATSVTLLDRPDIDKVLKRPSWSGFLIGWSRFDRALLRQIAEEKPEAVVEVRAAGARFLLSSTLGKLTAHETQRMLIGAPRGDQRPEFSLMNAWLEVEASGLFDPYWYFRAYGEVSDGRSALHHYLQEGEAAGRRPNLYFDPDYYAAQAGLEAGEPRLLHYLRRQHGTRQLPSPHFDNLWYRKAYGIDTTRSALSHYLAHRRTNLPNALVTTEALATKQRQDDPYETFLRRLPGRPEAFRTEFSAKPAGQAVLADALALFPAQTAAPPAPPVAPPAPKAAPTLLPAVTTLDEMARLIPGEDAGLQALTAGAAALVQDDLATAVPLLQTAVETLTALPGTKAAAALLDWVHRHWTKTDRVQLYPLLQTLQARGIQDGLGLIRMIECAVDAQDVIAGARYADTLHSLFPEAERGWALIGLARLRRLQGDQDQARALLHRVTPEADPTLLAVASTLLIELKDYDAARARLDAVPDKRGKLLEQARLRLALHEGELARAAEILRRVDLAQLDGWVLNEGIYRIIVPGQPLAEGQAEVEDLLIAGLAQRQDEAALMTQMFALLQRRRLDDLDALFTRIDGLEVAQSQNIQIRRLEFLGLAGRTAEALELFSTGLAGASFGKWEGMSVIRLLSEARKWTEAGEILLAHIRQGFGFGTASHQGMRVVRKARLHEAIAELVSSGRIATPEPDLPKFLHLVQEDHTLVQSARALTGQGMAPARSLQGMNGNWILDGRPARDDDTSVMFLCTNRRYFLSLLTFLSSFYGQSQQVAAHTYIYLDRDVPRTWYSAITLVAARFNRVVEIVGEDDFMPRGVEHKAEYGFFAGGSGLSRAAYFRLYAARHLMDKDRFTRALYVDTDIVCRGDLTDLVTIDLQGAALAARIEDYGPEVQAASDLNGLDARRYFNSGVLVFDFAHAELRDRIEAAIRLSEVEPDRLVFHDQCALNIAFTTCFKPLEPQWNFFLRPHRARNGHIEDGMLLHYLDKPKPWDIVFSRSYREEWRVWAVHLGMILPQPMFIDFFAAANEE